MTRLCLAVDPYPGYQGGRKYRGNFLSFTVVSARSIPFEFVQLINPRSIWHEKNNRPPTRYPDDPDVGANRGVTCAPQHGRPAWPDHLAAYASLVANHATFGGWEEFSWNDTGSGLVTLRANSTGLFVSADQNRASDLVADRTTAG